MFCFVFLVFIHDEPKTPCSLKLLGKGECIDLWKVEDNSHPSCTEFSSAQGPTVIHFYVTTPEPFYCPEKALDALKKKKN